MGYQLRVCDLRTDADIDVLPIDGVQHDDYIGRTGMLRGSVPIPTESLAQRALAALLPGRTMLYLENSSTFGTSIAWAGILWSREPAMSDRRLTMQIQAACLESYLREHRRLFTSLIATGVDQFSIVRSLLSYVQDTPGGDLGIAAPASMSGVLRDREYSRYDQAYVGELIDQLAACENGFEWRIAVFRDDAGVRHRELRLGQPKIITTATDVILDSPGPVLSYSLPEDAAGVANRWQSRGASINNNLAEDSVPLLTDLLTTPEDIAAGWPALDGTSDYTTVELQQTLDEHAVADLARARRPIIIPTVTYTTTDAPQPQLGGYVRLRMTDDLHPGTLSARYRVVGLQVSPEQRGTPETTQLFLEVA
ncbi:hypothetical protein ABT093_09620 [Kitasatospora sp. NPDC002551]|uniref:hypothetical protein n=1 Tax=Kitasatospora sp. NPDC002551 TaxID=3154539 RepID=UPI00331AEC8F